MDISTGTEGSGVEGSHAEGSVGEGIDVENPDVEQIADFHAPEGSWAARRSRRAARTRREWELSRAEENSAQAGSASRTPGIGVESGKWPRSASTPYWGRASSTRD